MSMSTDRPSICFVTNELYPLGPGGIGRMLYNFVKFNEDAGLPADIHFLVPQSLISSSEQKMVTLEAAFEGIATIHVCPPLEASPSHMAQLLVRARDYPWTNEWLFAESYRYYLGLIEAEERNRRPFDVIEFPDFGGWGVATIEAKRAGLGFHNSLISARVHSTQGMLYGVERFSHDPGHWAGVMFDAERHLLAHADLVVGHDPAIMTRTAESYGLEQRWQHRSALEFPPIYIEVARGDFRRADECAVEPDGSGTLDFLFSSRLQPVKRPDIFIRGAILFLERNEDYAGKFRLVCSGWDRTYIEGLKSLIPVGLRDKILFIENAPPEERQHYLDKSIVIIPSDYESLCLFAFEAALAGRKVILNRTCPAFGNGYRWRDGENCLLFDGSVRDLTATMERAVAWRAISHVDAKPSRPYWLNGPQLPDNFKRSNSTGPETLAIMFYGVQSPTEFNRHFDLACLLDDELRSREETFQIIFQIPRGTFDSDSPECKLIIERGWTVYLSSGNRECPEMLGEYLSSIDHPLIFLYPFGYEVAPDFIALAIEAARRDPSMALVSGHIELVDPVNSRSDFLRCFAGEAPSTALLSSRIAPPLCVIRRELVKDHPFDPLAGHLWFEVFARKCALRGIKIEIIPVIAGTLDALASSYPETTKRISAGLLDQLGRDAGWQARLLAVDPAQIPSQSAGPVLSYEGSRLRQVFRISPSGRPREWEPVGWDDGSGGVLIHPLDQHMTVGEIAGPPRRVSKVAAHFRNIRADNEGGQIAVALARSEVSSKHVLDVLEGRVSSEQVAASNWIDVLPNENGVVEFACYGTSKGSDKVLLASRVPSGKSEINCQIIFTGIQFFFSTLSVG